MINKTQLISDLEIFIPRHSNGFHVSFEKLQRPKSINLFKKEVALQDPDLNCWKKKPDRTNSLFISIS